MPSPHLIINLFRPFSFHWLRFFHSLQELDVFFPNIHGKFDAAPSEGNFDGAELKLETLNFTGIGLGDHGFDGLWKSCKRLKKLQLNCCAGIGEDTSVSSFNNCLNGLQEVELRHCGSLINDILRRLVENSTSLNSLIIDDHNLGSGEVLLQFITHSRCNLQKLDLSFYPLGNDHLLAMSEKFRGLLSLRLDGFNFVTAEGLARLTTMAMSTMLEELALIGCDLVPGLLTTLGQSLRNLRKLDLSWNKMADEEFMSMLASCNCLRELKVRGCMDLSNACVVSMFKSCKLLESVDIRNCRGIEAEAVELFVLNCMGLRQILVDESKLSDVSRSWASKKFVEVIVYR